MRKLAEEWGGNKLNGFRDFCAESGVSQGQRLAVTALFFKVARQRSVLNLRMLVYLVTYDSREVSLEHDLLPWYSSQRMVDL